MANLYFRFAMLAVGAVFVLHAADARAKATPEEQCQTGRYKAAASYASCVQKLMAKSNAMGTEKFDAAFVKCVATYAKAWPKLEKKARGTGSTCDGSRLTDNGDGTLTDRLTALVWEEKTEDATVHDTSRSFIWSAAGTAADGAVFTSFLAGLNTGPCFAGQCDWRLPTLAELATIFETPCTTDACVIPNFGPTPTFFDMYWSSTTDVFFPDQAWGVQSGFRVTGRGKQGGGPTRAVRGGL
jgi:uncharacterized protein DUF1566